MVFRSTTQFPNVMRGWILGAQNIGKTPQTERLALEERDVLTPGGAFLIFENTRDFAKEVGSDRPHWSTEGFYRVEIATGAVSRATFDPPVKKGTGRYPFGGSPSGQQLVMAEGVVDEAVREGVLRGVDQSRMKPWELNDLLYQASRTRLLVATFGGEPPRTIEVLNAVLNGVTDTTTIQWSPNGRLVAISLVYRNETNRWPKEVTVYDTDTWEVAARLEGGNLSGSASWGPDSDRVLVEGTGDEAWIHHLDGTKEPVTVLPSYGTRDTRPVRALGLADNEHLLTLRVRNDRATIMRTSLSEGTHERLLSWDGQEDTYPVIAQMPPETWR
ncbi:hypothetical protein [Demequina sp.]|uniref:hypothetical protein n=1 Tax=Demequina sp. TaxID=2050685 RepID=UPI003D1174BC